MTRMTLTELDEASCLELLEGSPVGRIGFVSEGKPLILPVNHLVDNGDVVFRTTRGAKLSLAERQSGEPVVYEADGWDGASRTGWSVLVHGAIEPILNEVEVTRLDQRNLQVWVDSPERERWVRVRAERITGRRIVLSED